MGSSGRVSVYLLLSCILVLHPLASAAHMQDGGGVVGGGSKGMDDSWNRGPKRRRTGLSDAQPGFERAHSDASMAPLYLDNLDADFKYWAGKKLDLAKDLMGQRDLLDHRAVAVVAIKNNVVYTFRNRSAPSYMVRRMRLMQGHMVRSARDHGLEFPDTVFFYNQMDLPACVEFRGAKCSAPVFGTYKHWNFAAATNMGDTEIAMPSFTRSWGELLNYPWEEKDPRAFMRANLQRSMDANATRLLIVQAAAADPAAAEVLDVGIVSNRNKQIIMPDGLKKSYVHMNEHSRWKLLINTNGHVASSRLGELLQMNSVVLSECTNWIEYYYRSIHPGTHFLSLNASGVVQQVRGLLDGKLDTEMKEMAENAQKFGFMYLSNQSKVLYLRQALLRYNALFPDMADFMRSLKLPKPTVDYLQPRQGVNEGKSDVPMEPLLSISQLRALTDTALRKIH